MMQTLSLVARRHRAKENLVTPSAYALSLYPESMQKYNVQHGSLSVFELIIDCLQAWGEAFMSRDHLYPYIVDTYSKLSTKYGIRFKRPDYDPTRVPIFLGPITKNESKRVEEEARKVSHANANAQNKSRSQSSSKSSSTEESKWLDERPTFCTPYNPNEEMKQASMDSYSIDDSDLSDLLEFDLMDDMGDSDATDIGDIQGEIREDVDPWSTKLPQQPNLPYTFSLPPTITSAIPSFPSVSIPPLPFTTTDIMNFFSPPHSPVPPPSPVPPDTKSWLLVPPRSPPPPQLPALLHHL